MPGKHKRRERASHRARVRAAGVPKKSRARSGAQYTYRAESSISRGRITKAPASRANPKRRNPMTKKQERTRAATSRKRTGIVKAVKTLLKKTNPSARISGARVVKLRGGGLTIRPVKANPVRRKRAARRRSR